MLTSFVRAQRVCVESERLYWSVERGEHTVTLCDTDTYGITQRYHYPQFLPYKTKIGTRGRAHALARLSTDSLSQDTTLLCDSVCA